MGQGQSVMPKLVHDIVQVVVYRHNDDTIEYLLIRRIPADGGFWQPVTGHIESGETHMQTIGRELAEETGLVEVLALSDALYAYEYDLHGEPGRDTVYAVEVPYDAIVQLAVDEHDAHEWLALDQAVKRLKYDGNKESLRKVHAHVTRN